MEKQKRLATINDISGFGKCSLTVALPLISAAGVETICLPTAVLSTHTGGFEGYSYRDLTEDMPKFTKHWHDIGLSFDAVYSGFLGSAEQIAIVKNFVKTFKNDGNLFIADPCMADFGRMYTVFNKDFATEMKELCAIADIILPNITEACFMTGTEYHDGIQTKEYIENLIIKLKKLGAKDVVLTGVMFEDGKLGAACTTDNDNIHYYFEEKIEGNYHGTGDVFACTFIGAVLNGFSMEEATDIAVRFTCRCIRCTHETTPDTRYGVDFEREIPALLKELKII